MIWEKLQRFGKIKKFKSLSEAARKYKLSQSTWSRDINDLEKNFGYRLISRNYSGIQLTQKGENLVLLVNKFENDLINLRKSINLDNNLLKKN